ncbi:MAG: 50S ribosomal protein L20 [Planctomycetota bacterium]|nr:MAG: 50S ribosomal protein L20 [Planctomycetota bacterium]
MPRTKGSVARHRKKKRIMKAAKGYRGGRSKLLRTAKESNKRAMRFAYIGRKLKKRDFRRLWITRISAACRAEGMSYSRFINGLKKAGIALDRKALSEVAIYDAKAFSDLVQLAKQAQ